jgi:uncharacterized membrane protein YeaQ/YmgE (transglycosylase-associated protein family)
MTPVDFVLLLIVAAVCGAVGQGITGHPHGGLFAAVALGFLGALLGVWIARGLDLPEVFLVEIGTVRFPVIWSIIGAALFVAVLGRLFTRRPAY